MNVDAKLAQEAHRVVSNMIKLFGDTPSLQHPKFQSVGQDAVELRATLKKLISEKEWVDEMNKVEEERQCQIRGEIMAEAGINQTPFRVDVGEEATVKFQGGAISTKIPSFHLIMRAGLIALGKRLDRGTRLKGKGSVHALNTEPAVGKDFVIERLGHVIDHASAAIERVAKGYPLTEEEIMEGGDAGAMMYGGMVLAQHLDMCADKYGLSVSGNGMPMEVSHGQLNATKAPPAKTPLFFTSDAAKPNQEAGIRGRLTTEIHVVSEDREKMLSIMEYIKSLGGEQNG